MIVLILFLIGLCTLCIIFLKLGRASADSDPLLDPRFNPNIRVEEAMEDTHNMAEIKAKLANKDSIQGHVKELLPA